MLTIPELVKEHRPCTVLNVRWSGGGVGGQLAKLPCSSCEMPIGTQEFATAWVRYEGSERSLRLCNKCGRIADKCKESAATVA